MEASLFAPQSRAGITPRTYQVEAHDNSIRLWDGGSQGVLVRAATGAGKTLMGCLLADTWLSRGDNYRCMVISYETQLVWQFAEEIEDYLGIRPGIEMESEAVDTDKIPKIVVASRQSLLVHPPATEQQIAELGARGVAARWVGSATERHMRRILKYLRGGGDPAVVADELEQVNLRPEAAEGRWSRVHKFSPTEYNWLLILDEAHRWSYRLISVSHIIDWFDKNPKNRRLGITATPQRSDGVSIGDKMFPAIALDYPFFARNRPSALSDGYSVPYIQRYIEVEGVDFAQLTKIAGDFDEGELERILGEESQLAKLVEPMLDMVGDRQTLIFSPGVQMAKNVAHYINARSRAKCTCGREKWYPTLLVGDGATCPDCNRLLDPADINKSGAQARELDGAVPHTERKLVYAEYEQAKFQFLSVCGLAREGFNSPVTSCVALFRPVSQKAASLAEQMKGRSGRPSKSIASKLHECGSAEERRKLIADSDKPDALIIDLVGASRLPDCASTVQIYADGLPDEIVERAEEIMIAVGLEGEITAEDALNQAAREDEEARRKAREEREAAEKRSREEAALRAKADAKVQYSTHEVGIGSNVDPNVATSGQYKFLAFLGMRITGIDLTKRQAGRIISLLKRRIPAAEIAEQHRIAPENWKAEGASLKQLMLLQRRRVPHKWVKTGYDASLLISAVMEPDRFEATMTDNIRRARDLDDLNAAGTDFKLVIESWRISAEIIDRVVAAGKLKRASLKVMAKIEEPIPD